MLDYPSRAWGVPPVITNSPSVLGLAHLPSLLIPLLALFRVMVLIPTWYQRARFRVMVLIPTPNSILHTLHYFCYITTTYYNMYLYVLVATIGSNFGLLGDMYISLIDMITNYVWCVLNT
jgi:hypothetical protein